MDINSVIDKDSAMCVSDVSREVAARVWCTPTTSQIDMNSELAEEFARVLEEYRQALIWCGGSDDFAFNGKAQVGYDKICRPLIDGQCR